MIGSDQLQYSDAIIQGQAVNRLRADCVGDPLRLFANGEKLVEARKTAIFPPVMLAWSRAHTRTTGVDILFDNFVVKRPGD